MTDTDALIEKVAAELVAAGLRHRGIPEVEAAELATVSLYILGTRDPGHQARAQYISFARAAAVAVLKEFREPSPEVEKAWRDVDGVRYTWGTAHKFHEAGIDALLTQLEASDA